MTEIIELQTERLILRQWRKEDWSEFAKLNADPVVMEYYPSILSMEESNAMAQKIEELLSKRGWGFWAVESISEKTFMGFVGLHEPTYDLPVTPCIEIGWRLAKEYWGKGYATEAAKASVSNRQSWAVMERLKMVNTKENFEHPHIPKNNPLRVHVLYKITKRQWLENDL